MRSKVATLVPLSHLGLIAEDDYFLALSHAASDPDYLGFFKQQVNAGKHVTLDNSVIELGEPEPFEVYFSKAREMGASEIMLPDYFEDSEKTLDAARTLLGLYHKVIGARVMVIPQGETPSLWLENAHDLYHSVVQYGFLPTMGITYRTADMFGGSIDPAVTLLTLSTKVQNLQIHLLGAGDIDPRTEVRPLLRHSRVRGIDSSTPSVYAQNGIELTPDMFEDPRPPRNIDFLADVYDVTLLKRNIAVWKYACDPANN